MTAIVWKPFARAAATSSSIVIVPSLKDEAEIAQRFPRGYRAVKPYLRLTPQPNR